MPYFVQGLTMGLAYVAPIGVQNLFVIHSALAHPRRRALATAGIVIFFDVTLALACFFGVGVVMETFPVVRMAVLLAGSLVVLAIGVGLLRTKEAGAEGRPLPATGSKTVSTAFVVTWCNPQALIDGPGVLLYLRGGPGLLPVVFGGDAGGLPAQPPFYPGGDGVDQPGLRGGDSLLRGKPALVLSDHAGIKENVYENHCNH